MAIYFNYDDGAVKGNVTAQAHEEWVELDSLQWGLNRNISMIAGRTSDRETSTVAVDQITLIKRVDQSSPDFFKASISDPKGKNASIHLCRTSSDEILTYMELNFEKAVVSSYNISSDHEGNNVEQLTLSFGKVEMINIERDAENNDAGRVAVGYNVETGVPS